ncbi:MAG: DEAD/DEAH box helicase [Burkholderiaceae bacterium]|jgi:superfamily II DNA/RNA helicase
MTTQPTFSDMGLAEPLLKAIEALNFTNPTAVQAQAIPSAIAGGDWMVSSQTGSGKTVAYLIPVLQRILQSIDSPEKAITGPVGLVLCPTRELAQQVAQDAINLVKMARGIRIGTIIGGTPFGKQIAALRGAQLVISTPGRLLDLVNQRKVHLNDVGVLVVDEADRMLDLGFAEDLENIHALCAKRSQTLMYSATFAPKIMALGAELMNEPQRLAISTGTTSSNENIGQHLNWVDNYAHKRRLLSHWLNDAGVDQAIVFASTQSDTEVIARDLENEGLSAIALHGAMPQAVRNRRLKGLRDGQFKILVATDVAARGIDVPTITHVINFGLPMKAEDYVHRIGRTGRAGRDGLAITLAEHGDRRKVQAIERFIHQAIPVSEVVGLEPKPFSKSSAPARRPGGSSGFGGGRDNYRDGPPRRPSTRDGAPGRSSSGGYAGRDRDAQPRAARSDNDRRPNAGLEDGGQPRSYESALSTIERPKTMRRFAPGTGFSGPSDRPRVTAEQAAPSSLGRPPARPKTFGERSTFAPRRTERWRSE